MKPRCVDDSPSLWRSTIWCQRTTSSFQTWTISLKSTRVKHSWLHRWYWSNDGLSSRLNIVNSLHVASCTFQIFFLTLRGVIIQQCPDRMLHRDTKFPSMIRIGAVSAITWIIFFSSLLSLFWNNVIMVAPCQKISARTLQIKVTCKLWVRVKNKYTRVLKQDVASVKE